MVTAVFCAHELYDTYLTVCVCACVHVCTCMCMHVCACMCVCVWMHAWMGVCTCVSVPVCVWTCHTCAADLCTAGCIKSRGDGLTSVASSKWVAVNAASLLSSPSTHPRSLCVLECAGHCQTVHPVNSLVWVCHAVNILMGLNDNACMHSP